EEAWRAGPRSTCHGASDRRREMNGEEDGTGSYEVATGWKVRRFARIGVFGAALVWVALVVAPAQAAFTAGITGTTLTINGDDASDHLALRLGANPNTLQVDVGDDGSADFSFDRSHFDHVVVNAGA